MRESSWRRRSSSSSSLNSEGKREFSCIIAAVATNSMAVCTSGPPFVVRLFLFPCGFLLLSGINKTRSSSTSSWCCSPLKNTTQRWLLPRASWTRGEQLKQPNHFKCTFFACFATAWYYKTSYNILLGFCYLYNSSYLQTTNLDRSSFLNDINRINGILKQFKDFYNMYLYELCS